MLWKLIQPAIISAILAVCSVAMAQCDPTGGLGGTGADVIVGEITGPMSYGTSGGYYAYSIGTTSCNIGTIELDWFANTAQHPVISQNMFRLLDGKFEHIGVSWLKHGFTALQGNSCGCGCISSGTGTRLGVGCSDPYGASLNGNQGSLGARSEVIDPANGTFLYPRILSPPNPDLTFRRLRVHADDLDPALNPGALYFVEAQYVTPDDAAAGNAHNNASYRQVIRSTNPSNYAMTYAGSTQRQQQGIQAWQDFDPNVTLVEVSDGEGGLFILGYTVTQVGTSGLYDYEYALYNMNSTRAARTFSLPLPTGVISSNIEFHDVEYHSTEVWDGTDWSFTTSGGSITWSTDTAAVNPNANALRWGSLYNFRFTANSPPGPANVNIGLFELGIPSALNLLVEGPTATTLDCNNNGIIDGDEIAMGAPDCDNNGLLDECESDCDGDGAADSCELISGTDADCNGDLIPDSCQIAMGTFVDCDFDGVPDVCQIALGTGTDCDDNGELDSCQILAGTLADCDFDGIADICEIDDGTELDCDADGTIDVCQIAAGVDLDCDQNGILDACETSGIYEHPVVHAPPLPVSEVLPPTTSTATVFVPGIVSDVDVFLDLSHTYIGDLKIDLSSPNGTIVRLHNSSGGGSDDIIATYDDDGGAGTINPFEALSAFDGAIGVGDWTLSIDDTLGGDSGALNEWNLIVSIQGAGIPDCNSNGLHDDCELSPANDCNSNGVLDSCDIDAGTSLDLDLDGVPDECGPQVQSFIRGDSNSDGGVDISDAIAILQYLFSGGGATCEIALDTNSSNSVDLADAIALLDGLFSGGPNPGPPFPNCGVDAGSSLQCLLHSCP